MQRSYKHVICIIKCCNFLLGNETPKESDLYKKIVKKHAARWKDLGVELEISMYFLDTIAIDYCNHPSFSEQCCKTVLWKWLEITPEASWNKLQKAIDNLPLNKSKEL